MVSKKVTIGLYVLLAVMGVANLLLIDQNLRMRRSVEATLPERLAVGDKVSPFTASGLNGELVEVAYAGEGRDKLLFFFTPSCPYSRQQFPNWLEFAERADKRKVEVLGLADAAEDKVKLQEYLDEMSFAQPSGIPFSTALVTKEVRHRYKLSETPLTLLVASDGTVKEVRAGKWKG